MKDINQELNELGLYKDIGCFRCGRKYPETLLNIEGFIHHRDIMSCLDLKSCRRYQRKNKKKKS